MKGVKCILNFRPKTSILCLALVPLLAFLLSLVFSSPVSAAEINIGNPTVTWTRQYTTPNQYPTITTSTGSASVPLTLAQGSDVLVSYMSAYFSVSGDFSQYTTVSGGMTVSAGTISGGDWTNAYARIRLSNGQLINQKMTVYDNQLTSNGGYVVYTFSVSMPYNTKIDHVQYQLGTYCETNNMNNCTIPLGGGPFQLQALWLRVVSENDAGTDSIIGQLGTMNTTIIDQTTMLNDTITFQEEQTRDAINNPQWVQDQQQAAEDGADDAQDDIENNQDISALETSQSSLISVISSIVTAIASPTSGTCIIPVDLTNYTGGALYNADLCHLSPPQGVTDVLSVIFIAFVVVLVISAIRLIFKLYSEVTNN